MPRDGAIIFADVIGKLDVPYKSGPSKAWLKIKNPKAAAANRSIDGTSKTEKNNISKKSGGSELVFA